METKASALMREEDIVDKAVLDRNKHGYQARPFACYQPCMMVRPMIAVNTGPDKAYHYKAVH